MKKYFFAILSLLITTSLPTKAQEPVYLVNGVVVSDISNIPPDDIESTQMLPADEETIALYGQEASNGVVLITLRYDTPALFPEANGSFNAYVAGQIEWKDPQPPARVIVRYAITPEGVTVLTDDLEVTDRRLKRRAANAVAQAPRWQPATRNGQPIESKGVLRIQLPEGKELPREWEIVYR